jgi:hypothetical protein
MVALLFGGRLDEPAKQSVNDCTCFEQIADQAEIRVAAFA